MEAGARTPEELETLMEDAFVLRDSMPWPSSSTRVRSWSRATGYPRPAAAGRSHRSRPACGGPSASTSLTRDGSSKLATPP